MKALLLILTFLAPLMLTSCDSAANNGGGTTSTIPDPIDRVRITEVSITGWPQTNAQGASWDEAPGEAPDLYYRIIDPQGNELASAVGNPAKEASPGSNPVWATNILFTSLARDIVVELWDSDTVSTDDLMGETEAVNLEAAGGSDFPPLVSLESTDGLITVELSVTWE